MAILVCGVGLFTLPSSGPSDWTAAGRHPALDSSSSAAGVSASTGVAYDCDQNCAPAVVRAAAISVAEGEALATESTGGGMFRREANTGGFSDLEVPMQKRSVTAAADQAGIGLDGVKVRIVRDPDLVGSGFQGYTHPNGKSIDLYPDAFANQETLVKTLGHERTHVYQVRTFGPASDSASLGAYEQAAQATESSWWDCFLGRCGR